jgi:hypothetical protein
VRARTEFSAGAAATLVTNPPEDEAGAPTTGFPDIGVAELSEHIREAGPGGRGDHCGGHGMAFPEHVNTRTTPRTAPHR